MQTLCKAVDMLVRGEVAGAADVLVQRFKAVEASASSGWDLAKHFELLPPAGVSATSDKERETIMRKRREELKILEKPLREKSQR